MNVLEIIGYIALGFIPTLVFMEIAWRKLRKDTEKISESKRIQN